MLLLKTVGDTFYDPEAEDLEWRWKEGQGSPFKGFCVRGIRALGPLPVKVYVFADRIESLAVRAFLFRNIRLYIEAVCQNYNRILHYSTIPVEIVEIAWENLPEGDILRRLLVDGFVCLGFQPSSRKDYLNQYPVDFITAVLLLMRAKHLFTEKLIRSTPHTGSSSKPLSVANLDLLDILDLKKYEAQDLENAARNNVSPSPTLLVVSPLCKDVQLYVPRGFVSDYGLEALQF